MPVNFKVRFDCPRGIDDPNASGTLSKVKPNGLEHKSHLLNRSHASLGESSINDVFNKQKLLKRVMIMVWESIKQGELTLN